MQSRSFKRVQPWAPEKFTVHPPVKRTTRDRQGRTVSAWDIRGRADGQAFFKRIVGPKTLANRERTQLITSHANGMWFDPKTKTFVLPPRSMEDISVAELCLMFWERNVSSWAPATRARNSHVLAVAVSRLTAAHGPIGEDQTKELFVIDHITPSTITTAHPHIVALSKRAASVTTYDLETMMASYRAGRSLAPASEKRFLAVIRACWKHGAALGITPTPSPAESVTDTKVLRKDGEVRHLKQRPVSVDSKRVISPDQLDRLIKATPERYRAFIALMGYCGLRPSEATAVRTADIDTTTQTLTVSRTSVIVPSQWVSSEDPEHDAPLKGRPTGFSREIPIPDRVMPVVTKHMKKHASTDLLSTTPNGARIHLSNFDRNVWNQTRQTLGPQWEHLRKHDLRHTACSIWLNAGIAPSLAASWSGHHSLAVFLDIYQGVWDGQLEVAVERLNSSL